METITREPALKRRPQKEGKETDSILVPHFHTQYTHAPRTGGEEENAAVAASEYRELPEQLQMWCLVGTLIIVHGKTRVIAKRRFHVFY